MLRARGESRWFPARARNRNSRIEESSNDSPFPRRFVTYATLRIPRESATPRAVYRIIVLWVPMIPSGSFTADDSSSSIVTEASYIRACCAITTISRQIGSSASTRATYAPENGSESLLGANQQQKQRQQQQQQQRQQQQQQQQQRQQQHDSNTESLF